jgi:hypothetical protein
MKTGIIDIKEDVDWIWLRAGCCLDCSDETFNFKKAGNSLTSLLNDYQLTKDSGPLGEILTLLTINYPNLKVRKKKMVDLQSGFCFRERNTFVNV